MTNEIWKPVIYRDIKRGKYEVSNLGRFRNDKGHIMTPCISEKGYMMISFMCNGKQRPRTLKIHRIVAFTFVPGFDKQHNEVNHKDGNKRNNSAENLEWITHEENIKHAIEHKLLVGMKGVSNPSNKYPEILIHLICELLMRTDGNVACVYHSLSDADINVRKTLIEDIKRKKTWSHISDMYFDNFKSVG